MTLYDTGNVRGDGLPSLGSTTHMVYYNFLGTEYDTDWVTTHAIYDFSNDYIASIGIQRFYGSVFFSDLRGIPTFNQCYQGRASGYAGGDSKEVGSGRLCTGNPPGGSDPGPSPIQCVESEWFACPPDGSPTYDDGYSNCDWYGCDHSPIVISLAPGGRYDLTSIENGVQFDLDADGSRNRVSWTAAGSPLAFLALDRNGNGVIDNGAELFGNSTPKPGGIAANGFDALAPYDANGDFEITSADPVWPHLLLWTDTNHDGVSQREELSTVVSSKIRALGTRYHWTGGRDRYNNTYRWQSKVTFAHAHQPYYDIYFRIQK